MPRFLVGILFLTLCPSLAAGQQVIESVGSRALGMGGAFVAVADDATAVYWNPAGLATAGPVGATIGWVQLRTRDQTGAPFAGPTKRTSKFVSLGTWPVGLSYGHLQTATLVARTDGTVGVERLKTSQYGATILQSLVDGLVIGSTLKYVRGTVASGTAEGTTAAAALDASDKLDGRTSGTFDLDLALMADMQRVRVGWTMRNVRSPVFKGLADFSIRVPRQSRLGVAILPTNGLTLAIDVDLNTVDLRDGLRRMIAFGGEERLGARLAVRGGLRWNLKGVRQSVFAAGVSVALRPNFWLDGHYTHGQLDVDRGFGVALRAGF